MADESSRTTRSQQLDEETNLILINRISQLLSTIAIDDEHTNQRVDELHDQLISSFLEIAVGQTVETARNLLQTTNWNIDKAINLFLLEKDCDPSMNRHNDQTRNAAIDQHHDQLISFFLQIAAGQTADTAREFLQKTNWDVDDAIDLFTISMYNGNPGAPPSNDLLDDEEPDSRLSSLYRPPLHLLFEGSFEEAKSVSAGKNQWLLVNLQSRREFASLTLNRDVWSHDAVSQAVESSFILWQVYDHTIGGQKISTFYKIESVLPVVLVIDPITGQKMLMWSGEIEAHSFLEDLMKFMESGPHQHIASLTRNILPERKEQHIGFPSNNTVQVPVPSWGEEFEKEETCSSRNHANQAVAPSWGEDFEKEETCSSSNHTDHIVLPSLGEEIGVSAEVEETCLLFPDLTEEPKGDCDRSLVCSLCVRFPDGRRKQRKFLKTEPVQLLWSFCYSHMEGSERKAFKLVQAIPGASKTLDYGADLTFDESGLANSMISVTWE